MISFNPNLRLPKLSKLPRLRKLFKLPSLPKLWRFGKGGQPGEKGSPPKSLGGVRGSGSFNPPPWPQLVMAGIGIVVAAVSCTIANLYEWIGDVFVRGPCAFLFISGWMFALTFATEAYDDARANEDSDQDDR
jgi:hypothetical protein